MTQFVGQTDIYDRLAKAKIRAGKICKFPDCQLQAGHVVKWKTVKDENGKKHRIAEINQARFCWYHGNRATQKTQNKTG